MKFRSFFLAVLVMGLCMFSFLSATEAAPLGDRPLSIGMTGDDVRELQAKLRTVGVDPGPIDGKYGHMTQSAVMLIQQVKELPVDGIAGPEVIELINQHVAQGSRGLAAPERYKRVIAMHSTAYSPASAGGNITYSGTRVRRGVVAVDPNVIPLGTRMYIDGYGYAIAEDIGGAIKGNTVDVAFLSLNECYQWGVRDVNVYILD